MGAEPTFTPTEAARACGVSVDTIRRRLRSGQIPGAVRLDAAPTGAWSLPRSGLAAAGLTVRPLIDTLAADPGTPPTGVSLAEVARLQADIARWQERAEAAERLVLELRDEIAFSRRVVEQLAASKQRAA